MNGLNHVSAGTLLMWLCNLTRPSLEDGLVFHLRKEDKFLFPEVKSCIEQ